MSDRRYHEEEVRKIFKLATSDKIAHAPGSSAASGLTLPEMQSIGVEVGVDPDAVARAAAALDDRPTPPTEKARSSFGMPIQVGTTVDIPRNLTDTEWGILVGELRGIFRADGRPAVHGGLREWSNGNLRVTIEPTEQGARLRSGTLKGSAQASNLLGAVAFAGSFLFLAALALSGGLGAAFTGGAEKFIVPAFFGAGGAATLLSNWVRLPRWAERRQQQMDYIATRVRELTKPKAHPSVEAGES